MMIWFWGDNLYVKIVRIMVYVIINIDCICNLLGVKEYWVCVWVVVFMV